MATIPGTTGPDRLVGTDEADFMLAWEGNDTLEGRRGDDYMSGGDDRDTYYITPGDGQDTVILQVGDLLVFTGFSKIDSFDDFNGFITDTRKGATIDVSGAEGDGGSQTIRVDGRDPSASNVSFFSIKSLEQEGSPTLRPKEETDVVETRLDPEIPTLQEVGIKPPRLDEDSIFG
jgi:hypothetical protein